MRSAPAVSAEQAMAVIIISDTVLFVETEIIERQTEIKHMSASGLLLNISIFCLPVVFL